MSLRLEIQDNKFRVITQEFSTKWMPDKPENRKTVVVMLRYLVDEQGKALFTFQELAVILESEERQAASQHVEDFRESGEEFLAMLMRQKKVDAEVIEAVKICLRETPLAQPAELAQRVNEQLGRQDITDSNVRAALDEISCQELRETIKKQIEQGQAHYREEYVLQRLFEIALANVENCPKIATLNAETIEAVKATVPCGTLPQTESIPMEEAKELFSTNVSEQQLAAVWDTPLAWKLWALLLYLQGVSTAAIGGWVGVNKSTVCRWLDQVADWEKYCFKDKKVESSGKVAVDEKWIKVGGVVWYLFAAVDCITGCPLHIALYNSNNGVHCKLFLLELKQLGYNPTVIITDGWDAYLQAIKDVFPCAEHLYCRFHALQALFRRLKKAYIFSSSVFKSVCNLFKSPYKRTTERRLEKLKASIDSLQASHVLSGLLAKWPILLKTVGSLRLPSTSNAVERFFGAFDRLYRLKGPFCDEASAQKHLQLFMLGYMLTIGQQGQPCPLEKAGGNVVNMPLYHLLNRPNVIALKEKIAEQYRTAS